MDHLRFRFAYFAYFAYLGAWGPYWTVYFTDGLGFDQALTGRLAALLVASLVVATWFAGRVADARHCRAGLQRGLSLLAVLSSALWLIVRTPAEAAVLMILHGAAAHTQVPMLDAAVVDALGTERRRFGYIRMAGTVGWGLAALLLGFFRHGHPEAVVVAMAGCMALFHLATWTLPKTQTATVVRRPRLDLAAAARSRPLQVLLLTTLLYATAFAVYDVFGAIHFAEAGLTTKQVSLLYASATVSEILVFTLAPRLLHRFPATGLALFSAAIAALRWWALPAITSFPALMAQQLTHGIVFGLYYASTLHLIGHLVRPEVRTTGQALFSMTFSSGMGLGGLLAGWSRSVTSGPTTFHYAAVLGAVTFLLLATAARAFRHAVPVGAVARGGSE